MPYTATLPVMIVDDEPRVLEAFRLILGSSGFQKVVCVQDSRQVRDLLSQQRFCAVVTDLGMPHLCGEAVLAQTTENHPEVPVIVMTARNEIEVAVRCIKAGAADYLVKPVEPERFLTSLRTATEARSQRAEAIALREGLLATNYRLHEAFAGIQTESRAMVNALHFLEVFARTPHPILITGETGVGKELAAHAVHAISGRKGPFLAMNVGAIDDTLFAVTLFGHAAGAYTDARGAREGQVASAAGGTLFLDEIGTLPEASQVKLLRLIQNGDYLPVGSDKPRQCNARIVVATNVDVARSAASGGGFRKDLYFRLQAHHVALPPLRKRSEDLPLLVAAFLEAEARSSGRAAPTVSPALFPLLRTYDFPGNVRELQNMCQRALALHERGVLSTGVFREMIAGERGSQKVESAGEEEPRDASWLPYPLPTLKEMDRIIEDEAMRRAFGVQTNAAEMLGITHQAMHQRLAKRKKAGGKPGRRPVRRKTAPA
jgi:two-component system nitrogen regulation response regulator GlnG